YINVYQYIPVTAGNEYTMEVWIEAENITTGRARIFVEWYTDLHTSGGTKVGNIDTGNVSGNTPYTKVSHTAFAPSGIQYLRLYLSLIPGTGAAYFDDVSVKENAAAASFFREYAEKSIEKHTPIKRIYNISVENTVDLSPIVKNMSIGPDDTITVCIYDIQGNLIQNVYSGSFIEEKNIIWDMKAENGNKLTTGVYIYSIQNTGEGLFIRKKGTILLVE
ncbi:hypothetical protein ACFL6D_05480, partial [Spirochaetota bacterium]